MTISLKHAFTSAKADGGDSTLVRPSNWNAEHNLTLASSKLLGRLTAGSGAVEEISFTSFGASLFNVANISAWVGASGIQGHSMTWTASTTVNARFDAKQDFLFTGVLTPPALGASTNDWAPTDHAINTRWRISASTTGTVTGIAGGVAGRLLALDNVGANNITLTSEDSNSTAANRFTFASNVVLRPNTSVVLTYDGTTSRWRLFTSFSGVQVPTVQDLTSGSGATYTRPAGCTLIKVRAIGGGGGGAGGDSTPGGTGGTTSFNSITAIGGSGGTSNSGANAGAGGAGGTGGVGVAHLRIAGTAGLTGTSAASDGRAGGAGGSSPFGGGGSGGRSVDEAGKAPAANTGAGGGGGGESSEGSQGGGGSGEYYELWIANPSPTYTYTVGAGGTAGAGGGGSDPAGGAGASGRIIVEEFY